jgi:hypothetical protein
VLEPRRRLLVVAEGEVTEKEYLEGFVARCRNQLVAFEFVGDAGVPMTLVERAKSLRDDATELARRERDDYLAYDEVWCVFDIDEHPRVGEAREMARDNGLRLAVSNPCFELWLVLHLKDNPGMQHRHDMQDLLQNLMPNVRLKHIDFEQLIGGYELAYQRAKRMARDAEEEGEALRNPSTEVYLLTDSIDEAGRAQRAQRERERAQERGRQAEESRRKADAAAAAAYEQFAREQAEAIALDESESTSRDS